MLKLKRSHAILYLPGNAGGFDVRNCPNAEQLAKDIELAVNNHDELVRLLRAAGEVDGFKLKPDDAVAYRALLDAIDPPPTLDEALGLLATCRSELAVARGKWPIEVDLLLDRAHRAKARK